MTIWRFFDTRRAVASLEFALVLPVLLMFAGGLADFGLALAAKDKLANAVSLGAQYAYLNAPTVTALTIQNLVSSTSSLQGVTVNVTGPACYCITTNSTPALTSTACSSTCSDGTKAGTYVIITASYTYPALMPAYSKLANMTLTESRTARIK
jgi:Flp pilus assembly protein TadG